MVRNDDRTDIMHGHKRIGYIDADRMLHMIGLDGYATPVCEVSDDATAAQAVQRYHFEALR